MNTFYFIFICIFIYPLIQTATATKSTHNLQKKRNIILLQKGENLKLKSPASEQIWLSKAGIVLITAHGYTVNIQAKKKGEVLLNLGSTLYKIQVIDSKNKQNLKNINQFFYYRKGLQAQVVKNKIKIIGNLYRIKDFIDFTKLASNINLDYIFEAKIDPTMCKKIKNYIYNKILNNNNSVLPFTISCTTILTAFLNKKTTTSDFYTTQLKKMGIGIQYDSSLLPILPLIELKILLIENNKNYSFQTDLNWGENIINSLLDGDLFKQLLSEFKTMENSGQAQILSETILLSQSGKKSSFHSGGDVPIPHFNPKTGTQHIKWKPYGIQINFKATADRNNKIHIDTQVNISEVDHSYSANNAPSIKKNRISSSITMNNGQSLLLSKLIRKQSGKNYSAPSMFSHLPLIGKLFSFKGKIKENTRLNIFITAKVTK